MYTVFQSEHINASPPSCYARGCCLLEAATTTLTPVGAVELYDNMPGASPSKSSANRLIAPPLAHQDHPT